MALSSCDEGRCMAGRERSKDGDETAHGAVRRRTSSRSSELGRVVVLHESPVPSSISDMTVTTCERLEDVADDVTPVIVFGSTEWIVKTLERIRMSESRCPRTVVAWCANPNLSDVIDIFRAGSVDCFEYSDGSPRCVGRPCTVVDAVRLDDEQRTVSIAESTFPLTRIQYSMVAYLVQQGERWVPAKQLAADVLGSHHDEATAGVRVHMHSIRKALGPWSGLVQSQRMLGYRFNVRSTGSSAR
jgi:DNA-binding winged helix-turn-helix (wHTH) protein